MYWYLTSKVLLESCMFREYKYQSRNRCLFIVIAKYNKIDDLWA